MKRALLVIDVQKIYSLEDSDYYVKNFSSIVNNINQMIKSFENQNEPIIYIKHEHSIDGKDAGRMFDFSGESDDIEFRSGSIETEFIDSLYIAKNHSIIIKKRYDAFIGTNLKELLEENYIEKVVICGFMTNFCCESTARHAHDIDYYVDFVADGMGTPGTDFFDSDETTKSTLATIESGFATIVNHDVV